MSNTTANPSDGAAEIAAIVRKETRNNIVINIVINGAIAYFTLKGAEQITLGGDKGYAKDLVISAFLLSTILGGIFLGMFRHRRKTGQLHPQGHEGQALAWLIPYNPWLAAPWIGVLAACTAAPLLMGILLLFGAETLPPNAYAVIKALWAGALAGIILPIAIMQGLRSPAKTKDES